MSLDHLPPDIERGVREFADELHISYDEALLKIIDTGLLASQSHDNRSAAPRALRVRKGPRAPKSTENPGAIIGLFDGDEGFRNAIDEVISSRSERYRFPE